MPRQRLEPGEHGKVAERSVGGKFFASTYVRDSDGKRRRVERSSPKSAEAARRALQRHLKGRRAPLASSRIVTEKTTLAELFELWLQTKIDEDGVLEQTAEQYRAVWRVHGAQQLGALLPVEFSASRAQARLTEMGATSQAKRLRMVLSGMFSLAVRFDVLDVNPIRETKAPRIAKGAPRAATPDEFERIRAAVRAYARRRGPGPKPGRLLPAFVDLLAATGCRPNEVLALRLPDDVDLQGHPPTVTVRGTLIDHGKIPGTPLYRQDFRKGHAPPHTVVLPTFGVETLADLIGQRFAGPVFANRDGGWCSLSNMRAGLRAALPVELSWVTPHSFRRTVATVVRDDMGPAKAQQQLSHKKLATTESHYLQRQTHGPDVRAALDKFAGRGK